MALDITIFQTIVPSRFISFSLPNQYLHKQLVRIAVFDSPVQSDGDGSPRLAALYVPEDRESDWIFSTESGHLQLLLSSPEVSRLILVGRDPDELPPLSVAYYNKDKGTLLMKSLERTLELILPALCPINYENSNSDVPISVYEGNLVCGMALERCSGGFVGEMLVEDVEIEIDKELRDNGRLLKFRRRLRFKRMPLLVQTEILIVPDMDLGLDHVKIGEVQFKPDLRVLVHSYLVPMVAGLSLISDRIDDQVRKGLRPKALCLGVGGGALLSFMNSQLGFEVIGVEMDGEVLRVARQYFGLEDDQIQVCIGDALEFIEELAGQGSSIHLGPNKFARNRFLNLPYGFGTKFDVVMVDLDSSDATSGCAPPLEFINTQILLATRSVLCDGGLLVVNVIPPSRSFYNTLVNGCREIFHELYEIDVGNKENFVLIAKVSPIVTTVSYGKNVFLEKLTMGISGKFLDSIKKI